MQAAQRIDTCLAAESSMKEILEEMDQTKSQEIEDAALAKLRAEASAAEAKQTKRAFFG